MNKVLNFLIKLQASEGNAISVAQSVSSQLDKVKAKAEGLGASIRKGASRTGILRIR